MAMGGGDKQSSTEVKEIKLPEWVEAASQSNYQFAQEVANRPYEAYGGKTVAPFSYPTTTAIQSLKGLDDLFKFYPEAASLYRQLGQYQSGGIGAQGVAAGSIPGMDVNAYLNPYIDNVERYAIDNAERSGRMALRDIDIDATKRGAFGGTRQGVERGVAGSEAIRKVGELSAGLRKEGYDTATGLMTSDLNRRLQADTTSATLNLQGQIANEEARAKAAAIRASGAEGIMSAADKSLGAKIQRLAQYLGVGGMVQQQQQRVYDDKAGKWQERRDYPLEQLNILLSSLGMSPYGRTETTQKTSESSAGGQGAGMLGGFMQMLPGLMSLSDRDTKTDIEKVGHDTVIDVPIYAFRYKGDPKTYPKVVGPMAQDVKRKVPKAVRKVGKRHVIDLTGLAA